mgnify:CR=1 FL=1
MRALPSLIALVILTAPALAEDALQGAPFAVEDNTYRFGDLYRSERGTTVDDCAQMCTTDSACASWTLMPATFRMGPRCELKRTPGQAVSRPGATSGMSEYWQMDPSRHAAMRYQPSVPESRQPVAVPLDQLRPSPVPRTFGDPLPVREPITREPELLGASTQTAPPTAPSVKAAVIEVPTQTVEVYRAPGEGVVPDYVKQPVPPEPHPLYKEPTRQAGQPVFRDPALKRPAPTPVASDLNAVMKRQSQAPETVAAPAPAPVAKPATLRLPWTERDGAAPDYSVGGEGYVPGDADATAGFLDGVPEAEAGS